MAILLSVRADAADPDTIPNDSLVVAAVELTPLFSVGVGGPHDGRPAQPVLVHDKGEAKYVSLVSLCRALGVRYTWNPYTYRGWIETDSLQTRFTLKSPVLTHGDEGRQLRHRIEYDANGVLIPIDYLDLLGERWNGGRTVIWKPEVGTLFWGRAATHYDRIEISRIGHQSRLRIYGIPPPRSSAYWSPLGGLDLYLEGWAPDPESLSIDSGSRRLAVRSVRCRPNGSRILVDVAPTVSAVSTGYEEGEQAWQLVATTSLKEADDERFCRLEHAMRQDRDASGVIILACWVDPATDPPEGFSALRDLAQEIARNLSGSLGLEAVILEGRDAFRMAGRANGYDAHCLIGLRIDRYERGAAKVQIWSPVPRYHWTRLENRKQEEGEERSVPLFWSEVPALSSASSDRLASTLSAHIELLEGKGKVVTGKRPSRWLEGLAMPAVLIYPAIGNDPASIGALRRPEWRDGLARSIAFGISEAIRAGALDGGAR